MLFTTVKKHSQISGIRSMLPPYGLTGRITVQA